VLIKGKKRNLHRSPRTSLGKWRAYSWSLFNFCHDNVSLAENRTTNRRKRRRRARTEEFKYAHKENKREEQKEERTTKEEEEQI
jgi:hypothetical protein